MSRKSDKAVMLAALGIGAIAGLRSMTAPALVAWAVRRRQLKLRRSPLAFVGSNPAVGLLSAAALGELVADKLPGTPSRTAAPALIARVVTGALAGAVICAAHRKPAPLGAVLGGAGAIAGSFAGFNARRQAASRLHVRDFPVALTEDAVAIAAGLLLAA